MIFNYLQTLIVPIFFFDFEKFMYTKININEEGPIIPKITLKIFKAPFQKV